MVQLSHLYMSTRKSVVLTIETFVSKVMSLLFNMLSRLVITLLARSIFLNFMAAVTFHSGFGAPRKKLCHCFHLFPFNDHEVVGTNAMILVF